MQPSLLFVHGWAFDASIWQAMRQHLAAQLPGYRQHASDSGYFGGADTRPVQPTGPVIAIGHSLGAMSLLASLPPQCVGLLLINGFARFSSAPDHPHGTAPRVLERMHARLARTPQAVISDFRARCDDNPPPLASDTPLNTARLAADLLRLRDDDQRATLARLTVPVRLLAGASDQIVAPALSHDMAITDTHWHPGGHLLPASASDWCADQALDFIKGLPG